MLELSALFLLVEGRKATLDGDVETDLLEVGLDEDRCPSASCQSARTVRVMEAALPVREAAEPAVGGLLRSVL